MKAFLAALAAVAVWGPAAGSEPRFADRPSVRRVDDAADIPEPGEREFRRKSYYAKVFGSRYFERKLELRRKKPARNTNAHDEVPDSSWFTNRVGRRRVTPEELRVGPAVSGPPVMPLTVVKGKSAGVSPGFLARDAEGRLFLVKFGAPEVARMEVAAGAITNRLLWGAGYHVPADSVVTVCREDLDLDPKATIKLETQVKRSMTWADVEAVLARVAPLPGGCRRALASEFLPGRPKGGFPLEGRRPDDPNDVVDHEHRRELRGLRVFAAWLQHTDMKEENTLDMYVEEDGRRFLRHYLVDFGLSLGVHRLHPRGRYAYGWEYGLDYTYGFASLFAMGLWKRPWEHDVETVWPEIGPFTVEEFEPDAWKPAFPYWPFSECHATDAFWAAKIVTAFDRSLLEAAVEAGGIESREARAHLVATLEGRRDVIGRTYLERVTPLDRFAVSATALVMTDVAVARGLAEGGSVVRLDDKGRPVDEVPVREDGTASLPLKGEAGYRVVRLSVRRDEVTTPPMQVHCVVDGDPRVLGLLRWEW